MKTIASLMLAIALSLPLASATAGEDVTDTSDRLTAVLHTTLDPSLRVVPSGVLLNLGTPELTTAPEFAGGFGNNRMWVADASTATRVELEPITQDRSLNKNVRGVISQMRSGVHFVRTPWGLRTLISTSGLKEAKVGDEIILSMDANNIIIDAHLKAERELADARQSRSGDNIRWHSVADIALVMNNG